MTRRAVKSGGGNELAESSNAEIRERYHIQISGLQAPLLRAVDRVSRISRADPCISEKVLIRGNDGQSHATAFDGFDLKVIAVLAPDRDRHRVRDLQTLDDFGDEISINTDKANARVVTLIAFDVANVLSRPCKIQLT